MKQKMQKLKRAFLDTEDGQILYRIGGEGEPLLLLHQNINSSNEFRELIPIFAQKMLVIAMDFLGFGDSDKPPRMYYIEDYAKTVILLLDALGIKKASILGHHTGAFVTGEVAAAYPERVNKIVLANIDYFEEQERTALYNRFSEAFQIKKDGSHLMKRWPVRLSYVGSIELNHRCFLDELKCYGYPPYAPFAVLNYTEKSLKRFGLINCPTLILSGTEEIKQLERLGLAKAENRQLIKKAIPLAKMVDIEGGTIYMMNQMPDEISRIVVNFLDQTGS
ncbi:MAG: alpha/beta fold hydrolase [Xenococcaceae cyanobacterium]